VTVTPLHATPDRASDERTMNRELFGVFGDRAAFERFRDPDAFDRVVGGPAVTVGVRNAHLDVPGRGSTYTCDRGGAVVFGEVLAPEGVENAAEWLFERYDREGRAALAGLNGSYLVVVDVGGEAAVVTDPLRSWECHYLERDGVRAFGTDVAPLRSLSETDRMAREPVLELLHLGTVLGERTVFEGIRRVPADAALTPSAVEPLDRFVYAPGEFDYVEALADRLTLAIRRREHYTGRTGVLLSGGWDSRVFLSELPAVDHTYTIGDEDSREVRVARRVASQYDADHAALEPGLEYLYPYDGKLRYSQGIKETLHIHQAAYEAEFDVDVMYHGLLFDTLFKGYFLEWDGITVFGTKLPSNSLVDDPDPIDALLDTLGFLPDGSRRIPDAVDELFDDADLDIDPDLDSSSAFLRERLETELDACRRLADSTHNLMDCLIIRNQPAMPFRTHLADNYLESFVSLDSELLDWHLRTPPEHRNGDTFRRALNRIDDEILRHRPPSRPHTSDYLNQVERFLRRKLPLVECFQPAWPDRQEIYDRYLLEDELFPEYRAIHELPARQQLRVNDLRWWLPDGHGRNGDAVRHPGDATGNRTT
jgi:asparagine synthase (glutamine-hydrolysing)